jgi:hypothetical protein
VNITQMCFTTTREMREPMRLGCFVPQHEEPR